MVKVFAPASIGNIGIGFDILGMAIAQPGDVIIARRGQPGQNGLHISRILGAENRLPLEVEKNTAGVAALRLLEHLGATSENIELEIHKRMPLGSGLGSSAASAVAAVLAVSELLNTGLSRRELLPFACLGEQVASGGFHADNVAPSLLGGIVLVRDNATLDVQELPAPPGLCAAVVHPHIEVLTKTARAILRPEIPLSLHIRQSANIAAFVTGLFQGDFDLIGRSLHDDVIEPQRAQLIPEFYAVKEAALTSGALGCSISGAGPSVFALCQHSLIAQRAGEAMQAAFARGGVQSTVYCSEVNRDGARILEIGN